MYFFLTNVANFLREFYFTLHFFKESEKKVNYCVCKVKVFNMHAPKIVWLSNFVFFSPKFYSQNNTLWLYFDNVEIKEIEINGGFIKC